MKPRTETFSGMLILCVSKTSELTESQLSTQTENKTMGGKASNEKNQLHAGQTTKNVLVSGSVGPVESTLVWRKSRWMNPRNKTLTMLKLCMSKMSELT